MKSGALSVSGLLRDALLFWPLLNLLVSVAVLSVGGAIAAWQLPVSFVAALAAAAARPGFSWANTLQAGLLMAALVVVAAHLSIWMIDQSWDSRAYHGPAVIALREGWNPAYVTHSCDWRTDFCAQLFATAIDHYPKAAWYGGAQFYALWGDIDAAKAPNLLMLVLVFLVAHHCVSRWLPGQTACIWLSTFVLAGCPVLLTQLFSGYIDGLMAAALTCQILLLADFLFLQERGSLWRAAVMLPYLANLKLTGLVYGLLFIALAALYLLVRARHQLLPFFKWQAAAVLLALLLVFNPYGTNLRDHGNPFYPAYQSASSVIDQQAAPWFMAKNRVSQFLIATFSVQNGPLWWGARLGGSADTPDAFAFGGNALWCFRAAVFGDHTVRGFVVAIVAAGYFWCAGARRAVEYFYYVCRVVGPVGAPGVAGRCAGAAGDLPPVPRRLATRAGLRAAAGHGGQQYAGHAVGVLRAIPGCQPVTC
ncbi:MAG: hypothetical protein IPK95_10395 [Cellvibrionales bacterium]|nr:hypothetical protein [Cellvibrionales bacterium]